MCRPASTTEADESKDGGVEKYYPFIEGRTAIYSPHGGRINLMPHRVARRKVMCTFTQVLHRQAWCWIGKPGGG